MRAIQSSKLLNGEVAALVLATNTDHRLRRRHHRLSARIPGQDEDQAVELHTAAYGEVPGHDQNTRPAQELDRH